MIGYRMSRGPNLRERARARLIADLRPSEPRREVPGYLYRDPNGDQYWMTYARDLILRKAAGAREWIAGPWADVPKAQGYDVSEAAQLISASFPEPKL